MRALNGGRLIRRFSSAAPKQPLEGEILSPTDSAQPRKTNPFSSSMLERYSPHTGQALNLIVAALMLAVAVKAARDRGESIEREKRFKERIARVRFEISALEDSVGEAVRARAVVEADAKKNTGAKKFLEESAGAVWIEEAVKTAMSRAKIVAVEQFEADLWTNVDSSIPAQQPKKPGEKSVMY